MILLGDFVSYTVALPPVGNPDPQRSGFGRSRDRRKNQNTVPKTAKATGKLIAGSVELLSIAVYILVNSKERKPILC